MQPVTVSDDGESIQQALDGAADKLQKLLGRSLERLGNRKGRTSYSGDDMTLPEPDLA
jgi:ribosome-associated translation inhibitor RaiA